MFTDLSWSHMLLVLVVALVVVGPKDLPKLMHTMGKWAAKARGMADQFRRSFDDMARQSELDELRRELEELRNTRPLAGTERAISDALAGPAVTLDPRPAGSPEAPSERAVATAGAGPVEYGAPPVDHDAPAEPVEPQEPAPSGHEPPPP
ncbi:MAG: twin-arginine translocase subunit TatB [Alphaproteobacteria bacterium]|nr:twin-arginine translocase subunit TatB [Alphaproteobacteria bacterium]